MATTASTPQSPTFNWRTHLRVHPAAELFPLMKDVDKDGFDALVRDIGTKGLQSSIVLFEENGKEKLLDGRNRLDALALLGLLSLNKGRLAWKGRRACDCWDLFQYAGRNHDPHAIVLSLNVHRRHLNAEQKRDLIANVLKAQPEISNRQGREGTIARDWVSELGRKGYVRPTSRVSS